MDFSRPARHNHRQRTVTSPYEGIVTSIENMVKLARNGQVDPLIRRWAEEITRGVPAKDRLSEAAAIYYAICTQIRYFPDPANAEWLQHPVVTMRNRVGDCDDMALTYRAALGASILSAGQQIQFVVVGFKKDAPLPSRYTHVFVRIKGPDGQWLVVDPVAGHKTSEMLSKVKHAKFYST
jgi:hypothetical protein